MSWVEFDKRRKETDTIIIPIGSTEVYGPHMPLGTDSIVADIISEMIASKYDALISPIIEFNDASALLAFPGTLSVSRDNFQADMERV